MTLQITSGLGGVKPVATRTYRIPIFGTLWTEELYIVDKHDQYIALHLEKTPQKDGIKEKVLEYGVLRRMGRDEFLQLVEDTTYARLEQMSNAALKSLSQRDREFYETHPLIGEKAMEQGLDELLKRIGKESPGRIKDVVNDAQRLAEYIESHEDYMMMAHNIGKKQRQFLAAAFNQESWDIFKRALSEYFLSVQRVYLKTK